MSKHATTFIDLLRRRAECSEGACAYTFLRNGEEEEEASLGFSELDEKARTIASQLQEAGARPGERALLLYPQGLDFIAAFFGCLYAGVAAVPVYPPRFSGKRRGDARLAGIAADAQPRWVLTTSGLLETGRSLAMPELAGCAWLGADLETLDPTRAAGWQPPSLDGETLAFLQYTSGSTSAPKGVEVTHAQLLHNQEAMRRAFGTSPETVVVGWLPLYHDMGLIGNVLQPLYVGGRCVLMSPVAFLQRPVRWLQAISRFRATTSGGPSFAYELCARRVRAEDKAGLDLRSWTVAFNGAEPVRAKTLEGFADAFAGCGFKRRAFFPCYGLAEATLFVTGKRALDDEPAVQGFDPRALEERRVEPGEQELVGCGVAAPGVSLAIVDPETGTACPEGRVGEIWVAGESVAGGYWRRQDETAHAFGAHLDGEATRFLRTGDLGFLGDGELFITGRLKDLIILRGRNLYPQDIEATVEQAHPALRLAGGAAFSVDVDGEERLIVVHELERRATLEDDAAPEEAIRRAVAEEHEVQVWDVVLIAAGSLPKTSSGKVKRRRCRELYRRDELTVMRRDRLDAGSLAGAEPTADQGAGDEVDQDLAGLARLPLDERRGKLRDPLARWLARRLGTRRDALEGDRPLTTLGLDSLRAIELKGLLDESWGRSPSLAWLLEGATFDELLAELGAPEDDEHEKPPEVSDAVAEASSFPLSRGQQALWLAHRFTPESPAYNLMLGLRLPSGTTAGELSRHLSRLVARHPMLRTIFVTRDGEPRHEVLDAWTPPLRLVAAEGWSAARLAADVARAADEPFAPHREPPVRCFLFQDAPGGHLLVLSLHHLVADFWSLDLLARDLERLFAGRILAPSPLGYADHVAWQERFLAGPEGERQWAFWRRALASYETVDTLPTDRPRPTQPTFRGGGRRVDLNPWLPGLRTLAQERGVTLYAVVLAAWHVWAHRQTQTRTTWIGQPMAARARPAFHDVVGYFANPVVSRGELRRGSSWREVLDHIWTGLLAALAHQDLPFAVLVERLKIARDPSRSPLFQLALAWQKRRDAVDGTKNRVLPRLDPAFCGQRGAPYDLMLLVGESDDALFAELRYSTDLFEPTTAGRWAAQLATLLAGLVDRPEAAIHEVSLLSPVERHQVAMEWTGALTNGVPVDHDEPMDAGLHHLFAHQARIQSEAVAVASGDLQLSYGELADRARRLAERLRGLGVAAEARVALALDRRPELIVALLGVLEAGGAYVPLDLSSPRERLAFMVEDAGAVALVTDERSSAAAPPFDGPRLMLGPDPATSAPSGRAAVQPIRPANAAYVLYTSGSTGRPKGVVVTHGGARNLAAAHRHTYLDAADRVGQITSLTFDASAFEIWSALARGARLELVPGELARSPSELAAFLTGRGITAQLLVTPVLNEVARQVPELLQRLGCVWFGGEAGDPRWLRRLRRVAPQCRLVNLYGPTECSTVSTWCRVDELPERDGLLAIGRPFDGLRNRVLDPWLQAVGIGMPGELGVTGPGVARGYLERPALTAARFVPDPFAARAGERLYRTGDLVRTRSDGQLVFLRRLDQQIKIRGRRIELEEIEATLAAQPGVEAAVVVLRRDGEGTEQLVAFLIAADPDAVPMSEALRAALATTLPAYMIPAHIVFVDRFPLTAHDKVDRGALANRPLPVSDRSRAEPKTGVDDGMEALLAEIWCQVLELETVGLDDSFFELGGHSLSLSRVQRQLEERLERRVPIADLFQHPTIRSLAAHLEPRRAPVPAVRSVDMVSQDGREIAVIAMACRFPGAGDLEAFWRNLRRGELSIATLGDDELRAAGVSDELLRDPRYVRAAGVMPDADLFDAGFFGFSPVEAALLDPQQRVFLECAWEALERAGHGGGAPEEIGVFAGMAENPLWRGVSGGGESSAAGVFQQLLAQGRDFLPTRVSYLLGLGGPSVNVQSACSTSLLAVHLACQSLRAGECAMALAGGVALRTPQETGYLYQPGMILSRDGRCRAFDADADGTVVGHGVGVVLLKPLASAMADGDPIHAVIRGSATNNDGARRQGYTAPGVDGQRQVIARALAVAEVDPGTIGYVETHGTGTALGDPVEIAALTQAFGPHKDPDQICAIGSVKTNIGHLDTAAGVAGLIKTVLAVEHGEIPASLGFEKPNPEIDFASSPFEVSSTLRAWPSQAHPRRAGVSSFGMGGSNVHVVLEEAPTRPASSPSRPWQVLLLSARSAPALEQATDRLAAHLETHPEKPLADVAYTLKVGRRAFPRRRVVVSAAREDAAATLRSRDPRRVFTDRFDRQGPVPAVTFLIAGLGDHYPSMTGELYRHEAVFRAEVDRAAEILEGPLGLDIRELLYPRKTSEKRQSRLDLRRMLRRGQDAEDGADASGLGSTRILQPALFVVELALARLWMSWGVRPQALLGYSLGEYVAATLAGVFSLEDALQVVAERARLVAAAPPGGMLAVALGEEDAAGYCDEDLDLAAINGDEVSVIGGSEAAVTALETRLSEEKISCRRLAVRHAFHNPSLEGAAASLAELLEGMSLQTPQLPWLSNLTGTWITPEEAVSPEYWAQHLCQPVRFADALRTLHADPDVGPFIDTGGVGGRPRPKAPPTERKLSERGVTTKDMTSLESEDETFYSGARVLRLRRGRLGPRAPGNPGRRSTPTLLLEIGPGQGLSSLALQHAACPENALALPSLPAAWDGEDEHAVLLSSLGRLWARGVEPDWSTFHAEERRNRVVLPTYPFERQRFTVEVAGETETASSRLRVQVPGASNDEDEAPAGTSQAPQGDLETRLAALWQELLGGEQNDVRQSFFVLGGHSLAALQLMTRVEESFGVEVALADFFAEPTIAHLAATIAEGGSEDAESTALPELAPDPSSLHEPFPLTDVQQAYWLGRRGDWALGNVGAHAYLELETGELDPARFDRAWRRLIARHPMLRMVVLPDGRQRILPVAEVASYRVGINDLRAVSTTDAEAALLDVRAAMSHRLHPTDRWPLFDNRLSLLDGQSRYHFSFDVILGDAWSLVLLDRDLWRFYRDPELELPPIELTFRDYVLAEAAIEHTPRFAQALTYWQNRLADLPLAPELPLVKSPEKLAAPRFVRRSRRLEPELWRAVQEAGRRRGLTPTAMLLAVFAEILATWSRKPRFSLTLTLFNRHPLHPEVNDVVGDFTSLILFAIDARGAGSFAERAQRLQAQLWRDLDQRWVSGVRVLRELGRLRGRQMAGIPVVFTSGLSLATVEHDVSQERREVYGVSQTPQVFIDHQVYEEAGSLICNWDAVDELFAPGALDAMVEAWELLTRDLAQEATWEATPRLVPAMHEGRIRSLEEAPPEADDALLHTLFADRARRAPDAVAIIAPEGSFTYGEVLRRAADLARRLRAYGVKTGELVAVMLAKGWEQVVSVLGVLGAGAAYLPIDPALGAARRAHLLTRGGARFAIVAEELASTLGEVRPVAVVNEDATNLPAAFPELRQSPGDLAYVIFTSGSTGEPKGVMIDHRGAVNTLLDIERRFAIDADDRVLALASLSFDLSVWDVFGILAAGGAIVLPEASARREPGRWRHWLTAARVTVWNTVPALMEMLVEHGHDAEESVDETLRLVLLSGDWIDVSLPDRIRARFPRARVISLGGATEASIWSILHPIDAVDPGWTSIPYGVSMAGQSVSVVDAELQLRPPAVPGEILIGGVGVALGYWRDGARTAASFVPDPASVGGRLYRTGDFGRYRTDGTIELFGREDSQVKIRGHRIELGEVETVLSRHQAVRGAVGLVTGEGRDRHLIAHVLNDDPDRLDLTELRTFLAERLPEAMIPRHILTRAAWPLTANGKIDKRALAALAPTTGESAPAPSALPRNPTEEKLAALWSELLDVERVGIHDNFLELGGHSLTAVRLASRVRETFAVELPLAALFAGPTVAELAARIDELAAKIAELAARIDEDVPDANEPVSPSVPSPSLGEIPRAPRDQPLPLSSAQERLWFLHQMHPESTAYSVPAAYRLEGRLSLAALEQALARCLARHETLRTTFAVDGGGPVQIIAPPGEEVSLPRIDLSGLEAARRPAVVEALLAAEAARPFRLDRSLCRWLILRLGEEDHILFMNLHHILADAWSLDVLRRELLRFYGELTAGEPASLPPLAVQYADYAVWQRRTLGSESTELAAAWTHWREQLGDEPPLLELPLDRPRPAVQGALAGRVELALPTELAARLHQLARDRRASLFMVLLAGFVALLARYTAEDDVAVGSPVAGRRQRALEELIGFFVNTLVLRVREVRGRLPFSALVDQVRELAVDAFTHQDVPFEKLVETLRPRRDTSRSPFFQVLFALQEAPGEVRLPDLRFAPVEMAYHRVRCDLELHLWDAGTTGIAGELLYHRQLFDAATAARLAGHLESLLHHASMGAATPLAELELLSSTEHHQLLHEFAGRPAESPAELTVPRRFAAQVAATPDAVAVVYEDRQVSYRRLDDDAGLLARRLRLADVGPDRVVGCSTARSPEMLVGLLAILEAGGAYLPLDPELPAERGRFMIEQAQACVLLLDREAPAAWRELDVPVLELAAPTDEPLGPRPEVALSAANLIYVLYTSGSTGEPKGVAVPHGAVLRLLDGDAFVRLGADETLLQLAPVAFDASTFEIWGALLHGGRLALMPSRPLSLAELGEVVERERVSTLWLTSALFQSMVDERAASLRGVRQLLAGGDVLSPPHVARALAALEDGVLINGYGPTEGTTFASCHRLDGAASLAEGPVPIGRPVAGCRTLVVDPTFEPVAIGVTGELLLGGPRLARGYLHRPGLTAERFVPDPLAERAGERLYRTGDLVRWRNGGVLDFLRRRDQQLKIRGVRVEPAEIEQALLDHADVRGAVVTAQGESVDERRLVAWILPRSGARGLQAELRRYLRERLPAAMVPSFIAELEAFPLTTSGKVDRRALAERDAALVSRAATPSRSLSELEERIAAVCRTVLGVPELGPDDDFFADLGAHSLLLAMLQIRLDEEGLELSVTDLFQAPSVAGLAKRLESRDQAPAAVLARERWPKDVICLQEGKPSGKPPLFLLHALGGHVFFYRDLVRQLDDDQPVYAVQARGLSAGSEDAVGLEELVAHYTADVLTVEPDGPYLLAGCSLGGILAFEMAHQLRDLGRRVDFVALIDSPGPGDILPAPEDDAEALERFYRAERPFELERYRRLSLEEQMREYIEVLMLHGELPAGFEMAHCYPILRLATTLAGLAYGYEPRSYPGAIHFYRAAIRYEHDPDFPELPWIERSRGAMVHVVPGDHVSMMRPPQVDELGVLVAEHLARCVGTDKT